MRIESFAPRVVTVEVDVPPLMLIAWWGEPPPPRDGVLPIMGELSAELRIDDATLQDVLANANRIIREHAWYPGHSPLQGYEIFALHKRFQESLPWDHPDQRYLIGLRVWDSRDSR
ncbi:hypothetical protein [Tsukamurella sp. USMM236]|uniref:hypothetical protein n=1 Tax=Tsukamurella sp. USMM236 TaxID=3081301 RepID=UPI003017442B